MTLACSYPSPLAVVAPMLLGLFLIVVRSDRKFRSALLEAADIARTRPRSGARKPKGAGR